MNKEKLRTMALTFGTVLAVALIVSLLTACNGFTYGAEDGACAELKRAGEAGSQEDLDSYRRLCE